MRWESNLQYFSFSKFSRKQEEGRTASSPSKNHNTTPEADGIQYQKSSMQKNPTERQR